ncbi:hypothetical protein HBI56_174850 [Parastagonospora nodorum]|uniref:Rhodopsin domain-containing protein n=1 Tax=Phaeosphaeria nodorum (strain SN15 / ATCC MYA-4574 / FGSC 10173) TaxID=321614 RepID=A0A7U2I813_PHANO|nr:hypothetical protein HBH56_120310 [Parastagonospora nodorum]QRD03982.1 hypothetical protein JI435_138380 [Parastagonospora nodorum SN15]KAH3924205.1 hypothetical protein HBH54_196210 [Parastagonospora nodorum]KAH3942435.1 hypothetical protein HBH53_187280 [Parastagonospora nodorum]KAH3961567.1 hypothetical protein HBH51_182480 [Parastagonospora nodorum]
MGHIIDIPVGNDLGPLLNHTSIALYVIAVFFVAIRFITRACLVKKFGLDDLFIAVAVALGGLQTVTIFMQVEHGRGRHATELHVMEFNEMLKYSWLNMLVYFVATWTVKMSILALYYRIGAGVRGLPWVVQARGVWVTAGVMTAAAVASFMAQLLACLPVSRAWDIERQPEGCINGALFMQISAAINVGTDIVLLLFPLPLLPLMKFNKKQRTALALIFSIGLVPVIASTMRLCEIAMSGSPTSTSMSWQDGDSSWTWAWVPIWSQIEVDIGIVVASLPSLNPLLKHVWAPPSMRRSATPSELPDFPEYQKSWDERKSPSDTEFDVEGSLKSDSETFYEESSDDEDDSGAAKPGVLSKALPPLPLGSKSSKSWWRRLRAMK